MAFQVGQILQHTALPELGRARVEAIAGDNIHLVFEVATGGEQKVFRLPNAGLVAAGDQSQQGFGTKSAKKKAPAKRKGAAKPAMTAQAWGFDEAWGRFVHQYPGGFSDAKYLADERGDQAAVAARWREQFGPKGLAALKAAGDPGAVEQALSKVYQGMTLLYPVEWVKMKTAMKASPAGLALMQDYAAAVAEGEISEGRFKALLGHFSDLGLGAGKWTQLTVWPYLASAKGFPFVKPEVTKAVALGLGVAIAYEAKPNYETYRKIMGLYEALWAQLEPKGAKDWVDLQHFIWLGWG